MKEKKTNRSTASMFNCWLGD